MFNDHRLSAHMHGATDLAAAETLQVNTVISVKVISFICKVCKSALDVPGTLRYVDFLAGSNFVLIRVTARSLPRGRGGGAIVAKLALEIGWLAKRGHLVLLCHMAS